VVKRVSSAVGIALLAAGPCLAQAPTEPAARLAPPQAFIAQHCIECHNSTDQSAAALFAGLFFDKVDVLQVAGDPETWEKVVRKVGTGMMPPASQARPDPAAQAQFLTYLERELDAHARAEPNPGRPALHRVNRTEYANAIRDLLALEVDATALLPADDSSHGFDNVAGSLGVSPVLLERYVAAAGKISRLAMGDTTMPDRLEKYLVSGDLTQNQHLPGMPFGTRGGAVFTHHFPVDAEYIVRADLVERGGRMFGANLGKTEQLEVTLDGQRVLLADLAEYQVENGAAIRIPVKAGRHTIGAAFIKKNHAPVEDVIQPFDFSLFEPAVDGDPDWTFVPHLASMSVTGPYAATGVGDTATRQRIFVCRPTTEREDAGRDARGRATQGAVAEAPCARQIVETLATRAFRQPVDREQLSTLMDFYAAGREQGGFEAGIEMALRRILASPEFVFRFERAAEGVEPGEIYRISDLELASRLSFFLWSSIPDDELLALAIDEKLHEPATLRRQVRRMLDDPRSNGFIENFAGQWLYLRNLKTKGGAVEHFPSFDDNLRQAFRTETEMLFASIVREDRNLLDLLTADYTFVNDRLARHYGMQGIYGSDFRRVPVESDARRGILGHGSILLVTSLPERTSPVQRGVWVLENIVGAPVPTPPPVVPALEEQAGTKAHPRTLREQMQLHTTRPFCAGCHKIMDPVGFAMENFDAIGRWRTEEHGQPIDASARLVDGTEIDGVVDLRNALLNYSDRFVQTTTEKLMTYALGRGIEYHDMPTVRAIARSAAKDEYRFSSIILGIVGSDAFQMRAAEDTPAATEIVADSHAVSH
jgi:mono/diheme cytochrome c family protein